MAKEKDKKKDNRREERRRRRIRNQVIAYLVLVILLAGIGAGGYYGIRFLVGNIKPVSQQYLKMWYR